MNKTIKIILLDDHQIMLDGLAAMLQSIQHIEIVAKITDGKDVFKMLDKKPVDMLITDLQMAGLSGIDMTLLLKKQHPTIKVLLLTMIEDASTIREAIKAGVSGYIIKKTGREEFEKAIKVIMGGKKYFSESVIEELATSPIDDFNEARPQTIQKLTSREIEILQLIVEELQSHEIADKLCISLATVETHRRNLMQKLGVKSVVGLTKYALKHQLIS